MIFTVSQHLLALVCFSDESSLSPIYVYTRVYVSVEMLKETAVLSSATHIERVHRRSARPCAKMTCGCVKWLNTDPQPCNS